MSAQQIYVDHYLANKRFPGQVGFDPNGMRLHLSGLIERTEHLAKVAANETKV